MSNGCNTREKTQFAPTVKEESNAVLSRLSLPNFKLQSFLINAQLADTSTFTPPSNLYVRGHQVPLADPGHSWKPLTQMRVERDLTIGTMQPLSVSLHHSSYVVCWLHDQNLIFV